jgi:hypothetical protein
MTLCAGTRLAPCEIPAPLGAGGTGEVTVDSRLGRVFDGFDDLEQRVPESNRR